MIIPWAARERKQKVELRDGSRDWDLPHLKAGGHVSFLSKDQADSMTT